MKYILIFFIFLFSINVFSQTDNTELEKLKLLCLDESKREITDQIVSAEGDKYRFIYLTINSSEKDKYIFDCSYFNIGPIEETQTSAISNVNVCKVNQEDPNQAISNLLFQTENILTKKQCDADNLALTSKACMKDIGCNVARSIQTAMTLGLNLFVDINPLKGNACLASNKSNCLVEAVSGIIKNVWENIKGIGWLAESAWKGIKSFFSSDEAKEVEDKSSDALVNSSTVSESFLKKFLKDPMGTLKDFGIGIYQMAGKLIRDNFACNKWSGTPHISKCLEPADNWKCASCDQKTNAVCGTLGFFSGEIVTAYLTGGVINLAGKAAKVAKVSKLVSSVNKGVKFKLNPTAAKIMNYTGKAIIYLPMKMISGLYKIPGLKQYMIAMDEAFMLGFKGPKAYFALKVAEKSRKANQLVLKQKQITSDLRVAKEDLKLAKNVDDSKVVEKLEKEIPKLESELKKTNKDLSRLDGDRTISAYSNELPTGQTRFFSNEQKMEILLDPDYANLVNKYDSLADKEDAIEIISILKNHNKKNLSKSEIIEEFNKNLKQCH